MYLPHPLDRQNQQQAYERVLNSETKYIILKLPTGSGKSAIAAALAALNKFKTMALVLTKSLQYQYAGPYQFANLLGKNNYDCLGIGQQIKLFDNEASTADLCVCPKDMRSKCEDRCSYPLARCQFVNSLAGVTNYRKFVTDRGITNSTDYVKGFDPDYLFLDEGHKLSDITVEYAGIELNWQSKRLMKYCSPIEIDTDKIGKQLGLPPNFAKTEAIDQATEWLMGLQATLKTQTPKHPSKGGNRKHWLWHKRQLEKIDITLYAMQTEPDCWFVHSNEWGMTIKPLTAKYHFQSIFDKAEKIVIMSATIQPQHITSLGLNEFEFISFPSPIPANMRPVYDLDCPPLTWQSTSYHYDKQAEILAGIFQSQPDHWNGMLHFPSKKKTWDCANLMRKMTGRPIFVPDEQHSTDEAYDTWLQFEKDNVGAIACVWQFDTGVDAGNINTNICCGVPYPNLKNRYEKARFDYNYSEAIVRVINTMIQILGRSRRGFDDHYGPFANKFVGIADGKWRKLPKKLIDRDFMKSIVP